MKGAMQQFISIMAASRMASIIKKLLECLNSMSTMPKWMKYINKGKDYNSQTQQYFIVFLNIL